MRLYGLVHHCDGTLEVIKISLTPIDNPYCYFIDIEENQIYKCYCDYNEEFCWKPCNGIDSIDDIWYNVITKEILKEDYLPDDCDLEIYKKGSLCQKYINCESIGEPYFIED